VNVTFDELNHRYTAENGTVLPSVTQLVAPLGEDYDEPDELLEGVLDAAADRGTTMHAYLAHRLVGGIREEFEIPSAYEPYAEAVELFLAEHSIEPMLIETPLGCPAFAGTPDLVCLFDGEEAILDYKFVSAVAKSKVGAQLAGYQQLCGHNGIYPEKLLTVQFLPEDYRIYPVGTTAAHTAFRHCIDLFSIKNKKHPRGRIFEGD